MIANGCFTTCLDALRNGKNPFKWQVVILLANVNLEDGMANKIKLEITKTQLLTIIDMAEEYSSFKGGGEADVLRECNKKIRLVNRMLENNGLEKYKIS